MESVHKMIVLITGFVVLALLIGAALLVYNNTNYDNVRMQFGYCETYMPGNAWKVLVKCEQKGQR